MNWREHPIAILDTETTGTDPATARIVEVAIHIVTPDTNRPFAKSWLADPGSPIPPAATAIHGISDEMVRGFPVFATIAHELHLLVSACIPAAYNVRFDRALLIAEYLRARIDVPAFLHAGAPWIDVLTWARAHEPYAKGTGRHKLTNVAARLGVEIGTAHRAAGDTETTARVLEKLSKQVDSAGFDLMPAELDDLWMKQRVLNAKNEADFLAWLSKQPKQPKEAA